MRKRVLFSAAQERQVGQPHRVWIGYPLLCIIEAWSSLKDNIYFVYLVFALWYYAAFQTV